MQKDRQTNGGENLSPTTDVYVVNNRRYSHPVSDEYLFSCSLQSVSDSRHVTRTINKPTKAAAVSITAHSNCLC